jgi:hypothetical protein
LLRDNAVAGIPGLKADIRKYEVECGSPRYPEACHKADDVKYDLEQAEEALHDRMAEVSDTLHDVAAKCQSGVKDACREADKAKEQLAQLWVLDH